ncbi:MAG TPA: VOC family protein [Ramlibacter sp.]|jgi:catechol 2,3-dioxygenase-like lactoylglutathione lyase family enzyme|nr:VOC family protein [Ramlibacter sp.]
MNPKLDVITLAVNDLDKSLAFYRDGLGFSTKGIVGTQFKGTQTQPAGAVAFFELAGGLMLALYPRTELAKDAKLLDGTPNPIEFSLGHIVGSKAEVDELLAKAQAAGATVTDRPHDRPWGIYSGYFKDPDGHLWEVIWNPKT